MTRRFILNGLQHCGRLLDSLLPGPHTSSVSDHQGNHQGGRQSYSHSEAGHTASKGPAPFRSLNPAHFDYFCLYNSELGRHEAYYRAKCSTSIQLPANLATQAAAAAAAGCLAEAASVAAGSDAGAGGAGAAQQQSRLASQELQAAACCAAGDGYVGVPVADGELIHIEYSYKYDSSEVQRLAAAAGLQLVKVWSDEQEQYDLHLLQCV